jgi:hypothetical protein
MAAAPVPREIAARSNPHVEPNETVAWAMMSGARFGGDGASDL